MSENRLITKCDICGYEMDTLEDEINISPWDTKIMVCVICWEEDSCEEY